MLALLFFVLLAGVIQGGCPAKPRRRKSAPSCQAFKLCNPRREPSSHSLGVAELSFVVPKWGYDGNVCQHL